MFMYLVSGNLSGPVRARRVCGYINPTRVFECRRRRTLTSDCLEEAILMGVRSPYPTRYTSTVS